MIYIKTISFLLSFIIAKYIIVAHAQITPVNENVMQWMKTQKLQFNAKSFTILEQDFRFIITANKKRTFDELKKNIRQLDSIALQAYEPSQEGETEMNIDIGRISNADAETFRYLYSEIEARYRSNEEYLSHAKSDVNKNTFMMEIAEDENKLICDRNANVNYMVVCAVHSRLEKLYE